MKPVLLITIISLSLVSTLPSASADAQGIQFLLCFPGGPGTTDDAQPVVDRFLAKLSEGSSWGSASGRYHNDMDACRRARAERPGPQVVMVPLDLYLASRADWNLTPLATLENQEASTQYHIVARAGATLDSIKGEVLATGLKAAANFFSRVALGGQVNVDTDFDLTRTRTPLRAVKNVSRGRAAAALLDDVQQRALEGLPMAAELVTVLSGPALPGAIVAAVGTAPEGLEAALRTVCTRHAEVCQEMRVRAFSPVDSARLTTLERQLTP